MFPPSPGSSEFSPLNLQMGKDRGGGLHGWGLEVGHTTSPPHPELSHPAMFTARMAGNVIQLCPGSWETMFGDQLASLCLASAQCSSRDALPALDEAELTFCPNEPGIECYPGSSSFLQVSPLLFPASLILSDALAESWLLRMPSHVFRQHKFIEHLLRARACTTAGSPCPALPRSGLSCPFSCPASVL